MVVFPTQESGLEQQYAKKRKKAEFFKALVGLILLTLTGLLAAWLILKPYYYTDLLSTCIIKTQYSIQNKEKTAFNDALDYLKNTDSAGYALVCSKIKAIAEAECIIEHKYKQPFVYAPSLGCYVKGANLVHIQETRESGLAAATTQQLGAELVRYAKIAQKIGD